LLEIPFGEAPAETLGKIMRQTLENSRSVRSACRSPLLMLNDSTADEPVCACHDRVDRSGGGTPRLLNRIGDIDQQVVVGGCRRSLQSFHRVFISPEFQEMSLTAISQFRRCDIPSVSVSRFALFLQFLSDSG